jgi:hypothetical protein
MLCLPLPRRPQPPFVYRRDLSRPLAVSSLSNFESAFSIFQFLIFHLFRFSIFHFPFSLGMGGREVNIRTLKIEEVRHPASVGREEKAKIKSRARRQSPVSSNFSRPHLPDSVMISLDVCRTEEKPVAGDPPDGPIKRDELDKIASEACTRSGAFALLVSVLLFVLCGSWQDRKADQALAGYLDNRLNLAMFL